MNEEACKHDLACRKCGVGIGAMGLAAAEREDEQMAAALEEAAQHLVDHAPLVTTVRTHTEGAHQRVNIWLRGQHVGGLIVGDGQGEALRALLLSETIVARARTLVQHWKDQDGFNASVVDDLMSEIELVDRTVAAERRSEAAR